MHENKYINNDDMEEENLLLLFDTVEQEKEEMLSERFRGIAALRNNVAKRLPEKLHR